MAGMDYANTRLRAMRSRLLTSADYLRLMSAGSTDALVTALGDTVYASDLEAALARYGGLRRFDEVVRRHLVRVFGAMRRFYEDPERQWIELLVDRWDLLNLRAILRGQARFQRSEEILRLVVPVGRLGSAELTELAVQTSLRTTIDLLVAWQIPSRAAARHLLDAWGEYESTGDVVALEVALSTAFAQRLDEVLGDREQAAAVVLRSEIDETNLLIALRLRAARFGDEITPDEAGSLAHYLPAGRIPLPGLAQVATQENRTGVVDRLESTSLLGGWGDALDAWADHDDLVTLADDLYVASTRFAVDLFYRGDPLGFDIPVAYTRAQEHEAHNLHWIARGIVHGLAVDEIERRLVVIT